MTTDAQTSPEGEWIPRYFSDFRREFMEFVRENARQHADLGGRISKVEGELRVIKGIAVAIFIAVAAPALKYLIGS